MASAEPPDVRQVRAVFDERTVVVYQAYADRIANRAPVAQRFVPPFKLDRMTWIKPSFLWMMYRSGWATKVGQERVLAITIDREGFEWALERSSLSHFDPSVHESHEEWTRQLNSSPVRIQWDPERSLRGAGLPYTSIQVGLSRHVIRQFAEEWIVGIEDYTARARKIYNLIHSGQADKAKRQLPPEQVYPVNEEIAPRLLLG